jgi:diaminopimelate epimerase
VSRIKFVKAHACGNDFLVIEESAGAGKACGAGAEAVCAEYTGIGADGIEFLDRRADGFDVSAAVQCRWQRGGVEREWNAVRGGVAGAERGPREVALGTHGGVRTCKVVRREGAEWWIESGMGVPRVMPRKIEIAGVLE